MKQPRRGGVSACTGANKSWTGWGNSVRNLEILLRIPCAGVDPWARGRMAVAPISLLELQKRASGPCEQLGCGDGCAIHEAKGGWARLGTRAEEQLV